MKKAFNLFFLVLLFLPVALVLFPAIANPSYDLATTLDFVTSNFKFLPLENFFHDMFTQGLHMSTAYQSARYCSCFVSYAFLILLFKIPFDLVTFLPILCTSAFERKGDKK